MNEDIGSGRQEVDVFKKLVPLIYEKLQLK